LSTCPSCRTSLAPGALFCGACGAQLSPRANPDADPFLQQVIGGRYQVLHKIGSGGMGDVYLAQHQQVGQQVAIKFLSRRLTGDPQIVQRFFNEARAIARLHHPGAVTLNDFGQTDDGTLYIIMEYIKGEPLSHLIARERRLSQEAAVHIALQLCEVLDAAHKQGIIHRDLKPDNIMLAPGRKGRHIVKVLDFGIAKLITEENHLTQTGMVYGTPEFMSPEQAIGQPIDPRADLYAVACILYFTLTGAPPFTASHPMAVMRAQATDEPAPPRRKNPDADVSPALEAILMKALRKRPEDRQPSVNALADELEALRTTQSGTVAALPARDQLKISQALHTDPLDPDEDPSFSPELSIPLRATPEPQKADLTPPEGPASFGGPLHSPRAPSFDMGLDPDEHAQLFDHDEDQPRSALRSSPHKLWIPGLALLALLLLGATLYALSQSDPDPTPPNDPDAASPDADPAQANDDAPAEDTSHTLSPDAAAPDAIGVEAPDANALPEPPRDEPTPEPTPRIENKKKQKRKNEKKIKKETKKKQDERKANPDPTPVPKTLGDAPADKKDPPKDSPVPTKLP
jgi:serine/threonine protein kinase